VDDNNDDERVRDYIKCVYVRKKRKRDYIKYYSMNVHLKKNEREERRENKEEGKLIEKI
jgi:hypothetical protein